VLVNRVAWLAAASGNAQVRAIATLKLNRLASRLRVENGKTEADVAHRALLVADIKRYLDDPSKTSSVVIVAAGAPPGAPIGDMPNDWLAAPPWFKQ
jgi:hypothetical protein